MAENSLFSNRNVIGFSFVLLTSIIAILLAVGQFIGAADHLAVYNLIRSLIFGFVCIDLYRNPTKINFTGPLHLCDKGSSDETNTKLSRVFSYVFSIFNVAISTVLFLGL